jgi:hypothetical protein
MKFATRGSTRERFRRPTIPTGVVVAICLALLTASQIASAAGNDGWSISHGPHVRGGGWLEAVAAISADDIWAVGTTVSHGPLAEHWDGTSWTRIPTHVSGWAQFMGVAALGPRDVWAVGSHSMNPSRSLIERWNGHRWRFVPSPVESRNDQQLLGVHAVSRTDAWAVGYRGKHPLVEHWNGTTWHLLRVPSPPNGGALASISGTAADDLWAVGFRGPPGWFPASGTLVEHWDGSRWSIVHAPGASSSLALNAVIVLSTDDAWAVGGLPRDPIYGPDGHSVSEHWDGRRWTMVPTAGGTRADTLNAVAVASTGEVWTVGEVATQDCYCPLAERWNGRRWVDSLPVPIPPEIALNGVAVAPAHVWAVGIVYGSDPNPAEPVIERRALNQRTRDAG